jgi:MinD superfamily P-loop ATPase
VSVDRARKDAAEAREVGDRIGAVLHYAGDETVIQIGTGQIREWKRMADVLVSELEASQKERDDARRLIVRVSEFDAAEGLPVKLMSKIDQFAAAVSGVAAPTEKEER